MKNWHQFVNFHIRKQAKYTFTKKNENDSFVNLLLFAEFASGIWPSLADYVWYLENDVS